MFEYRIEDKPSRTVIAHWFLMSFNAGCINAGGFLATGRFVSHVTGFATLFGVDLAERKYEAALGILSVPLFFLLGSFIAGMLIDRPIFQKKKPHFDYVMALSALCLLLTGTIGEFTQAGVFIGGATKLKQAYTLLVLLCLACGLQNGALTTSTGRNVRTTHLTGLLTDLGLGLARLLSFRARDKRLVQEVEAEWLRAGSIAAFVLGSAAGALFFSRLGYHGFLLPAAIAAYAAWHGRRAKLAAHRQDTVEI